jgi:molybdopterin molybdotransferase
MRGVDEGAGLLPVAEAIERVLAAAPVLPPEQVALAASAGRVLATDVLSDVDMPPFDRCAMDGHALRSEDCARPGARLRLVGHGLAGRVFPREVAAGECVRVMTGAPLPQGCDAVQPIERATEDGLVVVIHDAMRAGQHVSPRAEELRAGAVALRAGALLGAAEVGVLAAVGRAEVTVHQRPVAAVVSTGDELVDVGERPGPGQIRNSNGPMLAVLGRLLGCEPVLLLPATRDDEEGLSRAFTRALAADLLLISGGVSRGDRDLVQDVLPRLGVECLFHGVDIQPGKPLWFGRMDRCLVFALPGNPVSALTTARLFVASAARKMRGLAQPRPRYMRARLSEDVRRKAVRPGYLPAVLSEGTDEPSCRPLQSRGSADLAAASLANATWVAPKGEELLRAGTWVDVLPHADFLER